MSQFDEEDDEVHWHDYMIEPDFCMNWKKSAALYRKLQDIISGEVSSEDNYENT